MKNSNKDLKAFINYSSIIIGFLIIGIVFTIAWFAAHPELNK